MPNGATRASRNISHSNPAQFTNHLGERFSITDSTWTYLLQDLGSILLYGYLYVKGYLIFVTTPLCVSTCTTSPSLRILVEIPVPTMQGTPSSLETIAA